MTTFTREQIDQVVDSLTMGDVQAAFEANVGDKALAGVVFNRAAKRSGLSKTDDSLDSVSLADLRYLTERITGALGAGREEASK